MSSKDTNWVKIKKYYGAIYADMAKDALEQNGIPCILRRDFLSSAYGVGTPLAAVALPTTLLVPEDCAEVAKDIIAGMMGE